ncbi:adenine phosphoribosyltransferase [Candidatus Sumerlaeota bacterium]|nr:adenine phosphoribosyltransferase [Candidatus Sumerlaeota bacterium]
MDITPHIRDIQDFPKPGIIFKDITPLLVDAQAFNAVIEHLAERYAGKGVRKIVGVESRGFIFGAPLACKLGAGFVPARKPGKLPAETIAESFELEYGTDTLELHTDAIAPGEKTLLIDDLLATGGTLQAAAKLIDKLQGDLIEIVTIIELSFLNGRKKLPEGVPFHSLMQVD